MLVDGYKRVRALRRLSQDLVGATCWDLGEAEALVLDRLMRTGEGATALEQGWLLHELAGRFALSLEDLGRRFARSASWVSRRLALVEELPEAIQEHVRRGALPAHAAMKHLVPLARANPAACTRLVAAIAGQGLTNREVGQLYAAWRDGLPAIRERVLTAPLLFLKARQAVGARCPMTMAARCWTTWTCWRPSPGAPAAACARACSVACSRPNSRKWDGSASWPTRR